MNPQSNYDFILHPVAPQKRGLFPGSLGGNKSMVMLGGAVGLLLIFFLIGLSLKGSGSANNLTGIAQTQTEIVRVATEGSNNVTVTGNQNLAVNVELTLSSQLQTLEKLLATGGTKLSTKTLALKLNKNTDTQLTTAQQDSTYDVVFAQVMQTELSGYLSELKNAYDADSGTKTRALLSADYTQTVMLYKQIPSNASLTANS